VKESNPVLQERGWVSVEWCRSKWNGVDLELVAKNKLKKVVRNGQLGEILTRQVTLEDDGVDFEERTESSWRGDYE
jgi:hypothetical protein